MLPFLPIVLTQLPPPNPSSPPLVKPAQIPDPIPPMEFLPPQGILPPAPPPLPPQDVLDPVQMRPLPGKLDTVPVLNSNSPEVIQSSGILVSSFPPDGMQVPSAHLNFPFQGRFDIFTHHVARVRAPGDPSSLFQGILIYNPGPEPVTVEILQGATYLTRPDALFIDLPPYLENPLGKVFAGPGSRAANDVLRGRRLGVWPPSISLQPGESRMLMSLPVPVGDKPNDDQPASNARSTLIRLQSSGPVYVADLAMFAPVTPDHRERIPTLDEWITLLKQSGLATPRDHLPTPFDAATGQAVPTRNFTYGRVSGISLGSTWQAQVTDSPQSEDLTIPLPAQSFAYGLSTLYRGRLNTGQIQTASMLARYSDTAYQAHGNYGLEYDLTLPLYNPSQRPRRVTIALETPLKEDEPKGGVVFLDPPENKVFFRGTVRLRYVDDQGETQTRYIHLVQKRGQRGEPLATLTMAPGSRRFVQVNLIYPADATPPQVLTIGTPDE